MLRPRSPVLVCCVLAGVMALLGLTATRGRTAPEASSPSLLLASGGTLELSNSLNGAAVLTARNMRPGSSASGTVSVSNTSTVDGDFSLSQANLIDTPGPLGGRLSDRVQLSVEELSDGGSTAQSLYSGVLSGLGARAVGTLRASQTRSYRFTVSFQHLALADPFAGPVTITLTHNDVVLRRDTITACEQKKRGLDCREP